MRSRTWRLGTLTRIDESLTSSGRMSENVLIHTDSVS